jgi:hypothetical protein
MGPIIGELQRPDGMEDGAWEAISAHLARLRHAGELGDRELLVGSAKELIESISRVISRETGAVIPSEFKFESSLNSAQAALGRKPKALPVGSGVQLIAQSALKMALHVNKLRDECGTGHGRAAPSEIDDEVVTVTVEAALLWSRWALGRLGQVIAGRPIEFINDLGGSSFSTGMIEQRLQDSHLQNLFEVDQRRLGVAIGQRAMRRTFNVLIEGVEACAADPSVDRWPLGYREGLVEGLFLDWQGYINTTDRGVLAAAHILKPHPEMATYLTDLAAKVEQAAWPWYRDDTGLSRAGAVAGIVSATAVLPAEAHPAWARISDVLGRLEATYQG